LATHPLEGLPNNKEGADRKRLYAVAVLIDGVNSFYQKGVDGKLGPVVVHPKNAQKWILSGPETKVVPDSTNPNGFRLEGVKGKGHSVLDIRGFQKDNKSPTHLCSPRLMRRLPKSWHSQGSWGDYHYTTTPRSCQGMK